jgi:hypothetical protein
VNEEPRALLTRAQQALRGSLAWGAAWPKAAAFLGRQALEDAIDRLWAVTAPTLTGCPITVQLICLPFYVDDRDVAYRARQCWYSLSSACHAHPYELAPTVSELGSWLEEVAAFISTTDRIETGA